VSELTGITPQDAYCDMGYRGHGLKGDTKIHLVGKSPKRATRSLRNWMKRRAAVEPIIGHLKSDYRLNRNHLKGRAGDHANVVLVAAANNMAKLLVWFYWPGYFQVLFRRCNLKIVENQKINLCIFA
jgi:IS5 family transposase